MKRELYLKNADIKYWVSEWPDKKNYNCKTRRYKIDISKKNYVHPNNITLEINLHKDVNGYGILGIQYIPKPNKDVLEIIISYVDENNISYHSELIKEDKYTYKYYGLPEECVEQVRFSIQKYIEMHGFSGGTLIVPFAVNSEVKSSPLFFGILSEILMEILSSNEIKNTVSGYECDELIKRIFLNSSIFKK